MSSVEHLKKTVLNREFVSWIAALSDEYFQYICSRYPDALNIIQSRKFAAWVDTLPVRVQEAIWRTFIPESDADVTAEEIVEILDAYTKATGQHQIPPPSPSRSYMYSEQISDQSSLQGTWNIKKLFWIALAGISAVVMWAGYENTELNKAAGAAPASAPRAPAVVCGDRVLANGAAPYSNTNLVGNSSQITVKTSPNASSPVVAIVKHQGFIVRNAYISPGFSHTFHVPNGRYQVFFLQRQGLAA